MAYIPDIKTISDSELKRRYWWTLDYLEKPEFSQHLQDNQFAEMQEASKILKEELLLRGLKIEN